MRKESTDCLNLQELFKKPVLAVFDQEETSSDGGALLLKAADQKLGLSDNLTDAITEKRETGKIQHSLFELITQRTYTIGSGYADGNDAGRLKNDPVFKLLVAGTNKKYELASQSSISRFENSVTRKDLYRMGESLTVTVIDHHQHRLKGRVRHITVDMDITDDPTHGQQEFTFYHGYYMTHCYLPLLAFMTFNNEKEQYLVAVILRPGNSHDTYGAVPLLSRIIDKLRTAFPDAEIRVRLDGGFRGPTILNYLDSQPGVKYAVGMAKNPVLKVFSEQEMEKVREETELSGKTEKVYGECMYAAGTWDSERRVIFKAEVTRHPGREPRDNQRFVVTNMKQTPEWIYYKFYVARGDIENRIKELLYGLQIDRTSCSRFLANQFRVLLTAAAYILMQEIRRNAASTKHACSQVWTIIQNLIRIGVRIVHSVRRIVFHMPASCPDRKTWILIAEKLATETG